MKISAALRRIYDDDETRTHYESTSIEISSEDTSVDDEYLDVKLSELEQLVVLYKEADV